MQKLQFEALRRIGLTLAAAQELIRLLEHHRDAVPVRVTEVHRETVRLDDGTQDLAARQAGRMKDGSPEAMLAP